MILANLPSDFFKLKLKRFSAFLSQIKYESVGRKYPRSADLDSQIGVTIGSPLAKQYRNLNVREILSQIKIWPICGVSTIDPPKFSTIFVNGVGLTLVNRIQSRFECDLRAKCRSEWRRFECASRVSAE